MSRKSFKELTFDRPLDGPVHLDVVLELRSGRGADDGGGHERPRGHEPGVAFRVTLDPLVPVTAKRSSDFLLYTRSEQDDPKRSLSLNLSL